MFHGALDTEGSLCLPTLPCLDKKVSKELMDAICFQVLITPNVQSLTLHISSFLHSVLLCVLLHSFYDYFLLFIV